MSTLTQKATISDVLKNEFNPNFNRESVTMLTGAVYPVGAVVGLITASGKYKLSTNTGSDGAQVAGGVVLQHADASSGDVTGVAILRRGPAIVSRSALTLDASVDDATKTNAKLAQLVTLGIVPRTTV